jgi:hypothetical protein
MALFKSKSRYVWAKSIFVCLSNCTATPILKRSLLSESTNRCVNSHSNKGRNFSTSQQYTDEAVRLASKFGYSKFECLLTTGGDDRSLILESGANKYHIKPQPIQDSHIFRGSCTGNPPTRDGYEAAKRLYESELKGLDGEELESALRKVFQRQRSRLAKYLQLPQGSEVILCPSGSDAEYLPIAIARAIQPGKKLANGVTQLNEIGAGTAPASRGKYFSKYAPFLGDHGDMDYLDGFQEIDGLLIDAREKDGGVIDASLKMKQFTKDQLALGNFPIVHGVFGGKTGVRDEVMPGSLEGGNLSLGVVDACQGRFTLEELREWLDQDSLVLFTSSKFYQAPPFCGAVIVPASIADKLSGALPPKEMLTKTGLQGFITDKELPPCLESWKEHVQVPGQNNVGLALRWEAGLSAMEAILPIPDTDRVALTEEWANSVQEMVNGNDMLDVFCVERSIVSIRIRKQSGGWLNMSEARDLFRWMSLDISPAVAASGDDDEKATLSTPAFIGQPVNVSESHAIVRIALGVESLLAYNADKAKTLKEDELTVRKLGAVATHFETLKKSRL